MVEQRNQTKPNKLFFSGKNYHCLFVYYFMTKIQFCHITQDPLEHGNSKGFKFCSSDDLYTLYVEHALV